MNIEEMSNYMKTIPFEPQGKLPENLEYLHSSNVIVEITEEQQEEITKILAKFDAHGGKLDKLYEDWRNKILYHAKTLTNEQFMEYWNEVQGNVL